MMVALASAAGLAVGDPAFWMPLALIGLFFLMLLAGAVLDGFDIGVGCLSMAFPRPLRDHMLGTLNPWRDANGFWLLLGAGLLLVAFPHAWVRIMGELPFPLSLLGLGALLRSASHELWLRSRIESRAPWALGFGVGSLMMALAHGCILGKFMTGWSDRTEDLWFGFFLALCVVAGYALLGSTWLIMRVAGPLRVRALVRARWAVRWTAAGVVALSVVLAVSNGGVLLKWGEPGVRPYMLLLWLLLLFAFVTMEMCLQRMVTHSYRTTALPFALAVFVVGAVLCGLAYSFFPFLVLDEVTIWDAAAPAPTLHLVFLAVLVALPAAMVFNIRAYRGVFRTAG